ncbi:MAG TPA: ABC transporter permease [Ferruginibacter sp.]|jgi:ABC-2 type transport system permease protein|nr:ABC transporter permease [Ferruginibacter sp.]
MYKLWATIKKDIIVLLRDKVGLMLMFTMPIILAIVITAIQNSTFELVNNNKVPLLLCNRDTGDASKQLITAIKKIGMFDIKQVTENQTDQQIIDRMHAKDALIAVIIPKYFSAKIVSNAKNISSTALNNFGIQTDTTKNTTDSIDPLTLYYHPVLQQSYRLSINGALRSALQLVQSKQILKSLYFSLNQKELPQDLENQVVNEHVPINEISISRDGNRNIPNATQHNIPAWTIFAMFFIVISLGSSIVREKLNGSFVRLKTLPTNYLVALVSKQLTYLLVTMVQAACIFAIGIWLFPVIGLPKLNLPADLLGLIIVLLICGWCAVSFAIFVGVFAQTQEQANGIGAVAVVLLAAIGGILVPSFAMPNSFRLIIQLSPLHWALEAFYGLFLEGGKLKDILMNIIPLLTITILIQLVTLWGLKRKNLI